MVQIPILNGIYTDGSPNFRTSYPVNLIPVPKENGISSGFLRPADGLIATGTGPGVDRGGINWNGVCYRVMGSNLVSISSGGAITMASANVAQSGGKPLADFGVFAASNPNPPFQYYSRINLTGATAIEFNVTAYTGVATIWTLNVFEEFGVGTGATATVSSAGLVSFSTASMSSIDWSKVTGVEIQAESGVLPNTPARTPTNYYGTFSFTFDGMNAVGVVVPAPGAAALVGLAGLVASRRRRN